MNIKKLTILGGIAVMAGLTALGGGQAQAAHCTTTVTASSSIQTAVNGASSGDVVCLDDSGGAFNQTVVFSGTASGDDDSGITLSAEDGDTPVLDGTTGPLAKAITLQDGVRDVTIEDLEIRDYTTHAIRGDGTVGTPLYRIRLRDLDIHDIGFHAIDILDGEKVRIRRITIRVTSTAAGNFAEAIRLESVNGVTVEEVHIVGGFVGVNFACAPCTNTNALNMVTNG